MRTEAQHLPHHVEQGLHAYLQCGILAHGFVRLCHRRGLLNDSQLYALAEESPLLAGITAASLRHTVATGERAGLRVRRVLAQSAKEAPDPLQQLLVSEYTPGVPGLGEDLLHRFGRHVTVGAHVGQERHQTPV